MPISDRQLLDALGRTPFVDSTELTLSLGEPHATVHRALTGLLAEGIIGKVSHGTAHLPSSQRYHLTAQGIREAAWVLGFGGRPRTSCGPTQRPCEWLTLLIRRMDAVAAVYRLAASMSPGIDGLRSHVEFHRRGRFDATITLHDGRSFGVVRQGMALRRRSLYDRLRAIAEYDYTRRSDTVLILVPSVWEERLTRKLDNYDFLLLDDLGYLLQGAEESEVLFTLIAERYERRSLGITSNLVFSQWEHIFANPMATAAAIDRVVNHSVILEFDVPSYRTGVAQQRGQEKEVNRQE